MNVEDLLFILATGVFFAATFFTIISMAAYIEDQPNHFWPSLALTLLAFGVWGSLAFLVVFAER